MRRHRVTRSPLGYWLAVILLAAATGIFVARLVGAAETQRARFGALRTVVVAVRGLGVGHVLSGDDVAVREMPAAFVPAGAAAARGAVIGRTVVVALFAREAVLEAHLAPAGVRGLAAHLAPGRRAIAVPVGAAGPAVRTGDAVDVLATFEGEKTVAVAEAATVLVVGTDGVTLALATDDTSRVADAVARGAVTLAVRSPVERPTP
jgi:pilus assembly protein CpaB